jgi:hypothetical protein
VDQSIEALPDREAMTVIQPAPGPVLGPPIILEPAPEPPCLPVEAPPMVEEA